MTETPTFSVVTSSYNQGRFIRKTIESVREQGVASLEHIVIDGGSTDETVAILKEYPDVQWVSEPDRGQTHALNKGLARARGQWIVWINSDDYLLPGALDKLLKFIERRSDAQFVYSHGTFVDAQDREIRRLPATYSAERETLQYWWRGGGVGLAQPGSFFRRELWERYGPLDESLHYTMDFDFWLKLCPHVEFLLLDDYLATYRLHEDAKTSEGHLPFVREKIQVQKRHWARRGGWRRWEFALRHHLMLGVEMVLEGAHRWSAGARGAALGLWLGGLARNPFVPLTPVFWRFLLRKLSGGRWFARSENESAGGPRP